MKKKKKLKNKIIKFCKRQQWILKKIILILINWILNIFIKRDENMYLFGMYGHMIKREMFYHNSKYLFMYLQKKHPEIKSIWLSDDEKIINELKNKGYKNIIKKNSLKGILSTIKAGYLFYDLRAKQVSELLCHSSSMKIINLWHGIPLKKIFYDMLYEPPLSTALNPKTSYYTVCGDYDFKIWKTAFRAKENQIKILGNPRLDAINQVIENYEIFMEKDYNNIKKLKESGKKLILYMPTFRDTKKDISGWLDSKELAVLLKNNNATLLCKLHYRDKNKLNPELEDTIYKIDSDTDIYPILKYTDCLLTDYSSINFDYLLTNKPIVYYVPDFEEYQEKCRKFYIPLEEFAVGDICKKQEELIYSLNKVLTEKDEHKDKRDNLKNKIFKYQDNNNTKRVVEFIKSLNN